MPSTIGSLRRLALTPSLDDVSFAKRGFPVRPTDATRRLEAVPQAVVCGFEWAIDSPGLHDVQSRLDLVEPEQRGFAYEGATMAYTVRDALPGPRRHLARQLLRGPAVPYTFLTYIGIGFAMARLPRALWSKVLPDLTGTPYFPTMSWLAVDGYGFDKAYFDTGRWVTGQQRPKPYPWQGHPGYFNRAVDQGIGRALWFIHGGQTDDVAAAVAAFATSRQGDLWSGVGLAASFAGGCDAAGHAALRRHAAQHRPQLALGAVFAAKARTFAGFVPAHTETAVHGFTELSVTDAAHLADQVAVGGFGTGPEPDYEAWRDRIRSRFAARSEPTRLTASPVP
ncbi:DUF1702 family protein [Dactylosporangium cerinum]|uniref:DUF1702 family protein n=1 Tax=Dactylosporangium cerinum TaxID=1434730 RepID=A0ABV9VQB2_9ACTN